MAVSTVLHHLLLLTNEQSCLLTIFVCLIVSKHLQTSGSDKYHPSHQFLLTFLRSSHKNLLLISFPVLWKLHKNTELKAFLQIQKKMIRSALSRSLISNEISLCYLQTISHLWNRYQIVFPSNFFTHSLYMKINGSASRDIISTPYTIINHFSKQNTSWISCK